MATTLLQQFLLRTTKKGVIKSQRSSKSIQFPDEPVRSFKEL
jgi:hypothetical protein